MSNRARERQRLVCWRSSSSSVCSLVPVLWIMFLSLKTPATATDGSFIPHHWTLSNYSAHLQARDVHGRPAQLDRDRADRDRRWR